MCNHSFLWLRRCGWAILITGIGGLSLSFGRITITAIATALILGIIANLVLNKKELGNSSLVVNLKDKTADLKLLT